MRIKTYKAGAAVLSPLLPFFLILSLGACSMGTVQERTKTAQTLAQGASLAAREIDTGIFKIAAFERIGDEKTAHVYIEGDGFVMRSASRLSPNPTPKNPLALKLAAADRSATVIYLARPCQYVTDTKCTKDYWSDKRYAPEVIDAMSRALDDIKAKYKVGSFDLIGFSGGGTVAALLAARREDIASLRTVAGALDLKAIAEYRGEAPLDGSLDPAGIAKKIAAVPQRHFSGADDDVVPPSIAKSFALKTGHPDCIPLTVVEGASHGEGWAEKWPALLQQPLGSCH